MRILVENKRRGNLSGAQRSQVLVKSRGGNQECKAVSLNCGRWWFKNAGSSFFYAELFGEVFKGFSRKYLKFLINIWPVLLEILTFTFQLLQILKYLNSDHKITDKDPYK